MSRSKWVKVKAMAFHTHTHTPTHLLSLLCMFSKKLIYLTLGGFALVLTFCSRELPPAQPESPYRNLAEGVGYVGIETCRSCHADIHATFIHTGMGRSFGRARPERSDATFGDHALVYDEASDLYYFPYFRDSTLYVEEFRLEKGDTTHRRTEKISYIIGSGHHTNSHIIDINGYIYQAPVTYYTQDGKWDMAPGFRGDNERFARLLTTECITCHNHYPQHVAGSLNKFADMPDGIECERCHGPGELHVREKLAGDIVDTARFVDYSIVNPRDLPRDRQMDLCQRCHLQGVAVLAPGKDFFDFKPGMALSDVMNVFLPRYTNSHEKFIMASQADRLRLSPCYQQSEMTCITCHNPHQSVQVADSKRYNNACRSCHGGKTAECAAPLALREAEANNCVHCHMPPSGSIDIPHVNITDHYISRENIRGIADEKPVVTEEEPAFLGLRILTKAEASPLEMAEGYIALFDKYVRSEIMLDSAEYYLDRAPQNSRQAWRVRLHYHFARGDFAGLLAAAGEAPPDECTDAWTAYRIGQAHYHHQAFEEARAFFEQAVSLAPYDLDFREKLGAAYVNLGLLAEAERELQFVLEENPKRQVALVNLGYVQVLRRRFREGEILYDRALALDPDYEQALLNKAAVRLFYGDRQAALHLLERVLEINPENPQARAAMRQL